MQKMLSKDEARSPMLTPTRALEQALLSPHAPAPAGSIRRPPYFLPPPAPARFGLISPGVP